MGQISLGPTSRQEQNHNSRYVVRHGRSVSAVEFADTSCLWHSVQRRKYSLLSMSLRRVSLQWAQCPFARTAGSRVFVAAFDISAAANIPFASPSNQINSSVGGPPMNR